MEFGTNAEAEMLKNYNFIFNFSITAVFYILKDLIPLKQSGKHICTKRLLELWLYALLRGRQAVWTPDVIQKGKFSEEILPEFLSHFPVCFARVLLALLLNWILQRKNSGEDDKPSQF